MEINKDARFWAAICHLSALIMTIGVPLGNILGPLVVWLVKKKEFEFVDDQGKEALNFQTTFILCEIILFILLFLLMMLLTFVGEDSYQLFAVVPIMLLMLGLFILNIGLVIMAGIRANEGKLYRYPFALRIFK